MAKGFTSDGVDFDDLFDPDVMGDGPAAVWLENNDVPLRYAALAYGTKRADVGYDDNGVDVSNLWAAKGTAVHITFNLPPIFINAVSNQLHQNGHASFEFRLDGTIWTYQNNPQGILSSLGAYVSDASKLGQYEIRVTKTSGHASMEGAALGAWLNLGASQYWWGFDVEAVNQTHMAELAIEIRRVGTTTVLASSTASLAARWNSGADGGLD